MRNIFLRASKFFYFPLWFLLLGSLFSQTHANVDLTRITDFRYECRSNGEGILHIAFSLAWHHVYYRDYRIDHAGFVEIKDANYTSISRGLNLYIPGCDCIDAWEQRVIKVPASSWRNFILWWSVRSDYWQVTSSGMNDTWVYANNPIRRTTTVITFYPKNDFPKSCVKCENSDQVSCRLYAPRTEYDTSTEGISFPLQSNYDASAVKCKNPWKPSISCDNGAASIKTTASSGTGINTFTVNIPSQTSSKTGSCVITYPADSCNRERKETIHLVEKNPLCDTTTTPSGCSYRVKKTVITPADWKDMDYGYALLEFSNLFLPVPIEEVGSGWCGERDISVSCTSSWYAWIGDMNDATVPGLPYSPTHVLFLSESIVKRPGTCVIQYKKTSCDPEKQEIITIVSGESGGEVCSGPWYLPDCTLFLEKNVVSTSTWWITVQIKSNFGSNVVWWLGVTQWYRCKNPTVAGVTCTAGIWAEILNQSQVKIPAQSSNIPGECTVTYAKTSCSSARQEKLLIQETPTYLTGVTITEKEVCFQVLNSSQKPILGLEKTLTTTLTFWQNTYTGSTQKYLYSGSNTFDITTVQYVDGKYCVTTPTDTTGWSGGGGAGGPPGGYPVWVTISWCNNPSTCALTHPGGFLVIPKKCTGRIQVMSDGRWTDSDVLYDENQEYSISVQGTNCNGTIKITDRTNMLSTGGTFVTRPTRLSSTGSFMAEIKKPTNAFPNTPRWLSTYITYTEPGGFSYGLTADAGDWTDKPLSIIWNRMRGVRVIGSIAGTTGNEYNINTTNIITDISTYGTLTNSIKQNVTELTRSLTTGQVVNNVVYFRDSSLRYSTIASLNFKTIIVYGNLIIDQNIPSTKWIIVLKDTNGNGGNVIVSDTVKTINAVIFTEGIFRGASTSATTLNPASQLVLKWALYSRNTIGWSADPNNLFLHPDTKTTNKDEAFIQDLNNVRSGTQDGETYLWFRDPFIIHYDSTFIQNPPPGF